MPSIDPIVEHPTPDDPSPTLDAVDTMLGLLGSAVIRDGGTIQLWADALQDEIPEGHPAPRLIAGACWLISALDETHNI